ncbi:hypothetical protein A4R26_15605 [Niastella populi]|uniref:Uncharacterized protein n=1 Tax=Niastella populi TaxID=550983 RepID=A0A1V9G3T5_9BACT|nr:hypothetical protein A4R26_15605 [Niastella populi]
MPEKDADCRFPLKAGQAVGDFYFEQTYLIIFSWKACFVQGLIFLSAHFFYVQLYWPIFKPRLNIIFAIYNRYPATPFP